MLVVPKRNREPEEYSPYDDVSDNFFDPCFWRIETVAHDDTVEDQCDPAEEKCSRRNFFKPSPKLMKYFQFLAPLFFVVFLTSAVLVVFQTCKSRKFKRRRVMHCFHKTNGFFVKNKCRSGYQIGIHSLALHRCDLFQIADSTEQFRSDIIGEFVIYRLQCVHKLLALVFSQFRNFHFS